MLQPPSFRKNVSNRMKVCDVWLLFVNEAKQSIQNAPFILDQCRPAQSIGKLGRVGGEIGFGINSPKTVDSAEGVSGGMLNYKGAGLHFEDEWSSSGIWSRCSFRELSFDNSLHPSPLHLSLLVNSVPQICYHPPKYLSHTEQQASWQVAQLWDCMYRKRKHELHMRCIGEYRNS